MKKLIIISFVLLASLIMTQPLMAEEVTGKALLTDNSNVTTGFKWDHCLQTYHHIGSSRTYCYLQSTKVWVWTTDDRAENMLIAGAASNHWVGINFNTSTSWNYIKMWKY